MANLATVLDDVRALPPDVLEAAAVYIKQLAERKSDIVHPPDPAIDLLLSMKASQDSLDAEKLSDLSLQEMVGIPVALHLPDSSADLQDAAHKGGIPDEDSTYRESVARFARALTGSPEEKPAKNRLAQMLGWG